MELEKCTITYLVIQNLIGQHTPIHFRTNLTKEIPRMGSGAGIEVYYRFESGKSITYPGPQKNNNDGGAQLGQY